MDSFDQEILNTLTQRIFAANREHGLIVDGNHILGIVTEEQYEILQCVHTDDTEALLEECMDMAVACLRFIAQVKELAKGVKIPAPETELPPPLFCAFCEEVFANDMERVRTHVQNCKAHPMYGMKEKLDKWMNEAARRGTAIHRLESLLEVNGIQHSDELPLRVPIEREGGMTGDYNHEGNTLVIVFKETGKWYTSSRANAPIDAFDCLYSRTEKLNNLLQANGGKCPGLSSDGAGMYVVVLPDEDVPFLVPPRIPEEAL